MHLLTGYEGIINQLWLFTFCSMIFLYIACNLMPDWLVGNILPLHNVFRPRMNVDLDYQSIGYAMLHTKWFARITHYTIILDAVMWFVVFYSMHWAVVLCAIIATVLQVLFIGERKFGVSFVLSYAMVLGASFGFVKLAGMHDALLVAKVILMTGGLVRMIGHSVEKIPPLLLEKSDRFIKLSLKNITWKIPVVVLVGYIAEFSSGLPNRLMPVQINFLYQAIFRVKPTVTLPWREIEASAKNTLVNGYFALASLRNYYNKVANPNG